MNLLIPPSLHLNQSAVDVKFVLEVVTKSGLSEKKHTSCVNMFSASEEEVNMLIPPRLHLNQSAVYLKFVLEVVTKSGLSEKSIHLV